ncbi:hypothetical protein BUALT_Bualt10G0034700 [Buddleja alternifolia]|uniref:Phytocyanin domain-containing protein n=1 Tax=Buddleja alternifolia TaxID=168488 RepID=A0AAV6WXI7_9LAMI|nr:hypothetical protein BUALT_Bualt10G0034700 [Buddleja alternifolia]
MASKAILIATIFCIGAIAPALATEYMVGDDSGWKTGYNYTEWVKGKNFYVGDKLTFMYKKDAHNVAKVNGSEFQQCLGPSVTNSSNLLTSGNDVITLGTTGKKWYICTFPDHCTQGMKLVISVSANGPSPAPAPGTSGATQVSALKSSGWILAALAAFKMIMA